MARNKRPPLEQAIGRLQRMAAMERKFYEDPKTSYENKYRGYGAWLAYRMAIVELRRLLTPSTSSKESK